MEPQLNQGDDEDKVSGSNSKQSYNFQASNLGKYLMTMAMAMAVQPTFEHSSDLQNDEKQRIALGENIMRLMRKLDTIQ
ncbi:hypothetical protein S245_012965, partial [Arachis hypogaea]